MVHDIENINFDFMYCVIILDIVTVVIITFISQWKGETISIK